MAETESGQADYFVKKIEEGSLQKFKNQNKLLKKFGKNGLKVYKATTKKGVSTDQLAKKTGISAEEVAKIVLYMKEEGMAELEPTEVGAIPPVLERPVEVPEEKPAEEKPEEEEPEEEAEEEEKPPEEEIKPVEFEEEKPIEEGEEIKPIEFKEEEEKPEKEEVPEEVMGVEVPKEVPEEEKEAAPAGEEVEAEEEVGEEEIFPTEEVPEEEEEEGEGELTPSEQLIRKKYGDVGIKVYALIDGQRTAEEIMTDTGVSESQLIEMLDYMEKEGIIRLEHPERKKKAAVGEKKSLFAPLVEGKPKIAALVFAGVAFVLDVPVKVKTNIFKEIQVKAQVMVKFKKEGINAYELMDGKNDVVQIAYKSGLSLYKIYDIIALLEKMNAVALKPLPRDEIRMKYGEDGYAVYKRYGRRGVMLYQLIGKDLTLAQMAELTSKDRKEVVEMFMFIHKLLGIDLPIDREVLYERLGITS